jgi:hypothetical protein
MRNLNFGKYSPLYFDALNFTWFRVTFSSGIFAARNLTSNSPSIFKMIVTELTHLLGIRVPVVQGGMQWVRPSASVFALD